MIVRSLDPLQVDDGDLWVAGDRIAQSGRGARVDACPVDGAPADFDLAGDIERYPQISAGFISELVRPISTRRSADGRCRD